MNISKHISEYLQLGLKGDDAVAKTCGDIILNRIAKSTNNKEVTIKGGFVMMTLSKNLRRATRDLDLDFIKYSLSDESILKFIEKLNIVDNDVILKVIEPITELSHQDYKGKRVILEISDKFKNKYDFKLDIGVHKNLDLKQEELCFDFNSTNEFVNLLVNSKEQIVSEKLKSLLKFGPASRRYKDVYDIYYLIKINPMDKEKFKLLVDDYILKDDKMWENNYENIYNRLFETFSNKRFLNRLSRARENWLGIESSKVIEVILEYFESLIEIRV